MRNDPSPPKTKLTIHQGMLGTAQQKLETEYGGGLGRSYLSLKW